MDTQAVVARAIRMEVDLRCSSLAAEMAWHAVAVVDVLMTFAPEERQHPQVVSCAVALQLVSFWSFAKSLGTTSGNPCVSFRQQSQFSFHVQRHFLPIRCRTRWDVRHADVRLPWVAQQVKTT